MSSWAEAAIEACENPLLPAVCPLCAARGVKAKWNIIDIRLREAVFDLHCKSCGAIHSLRTSLPDGVPGYFPLERVEALAKIIEQQAEPIAARVRQHACAMPAAAFTTHPLWVESRWSATTFQWHPTSESPPIMGLVFDNAEAGKDIFREAKRQMNHEDRFEEIRISIIEGPIPGEEHRPGYSVHLCADREALAMHATGADFVIDPTIVPFLGQWNRHYPVPGIPPLLPQFKKEFAKHNEFLFAPVTRRPDGKLYTDPMLGIIKNVIHFRYLSDITAPDDPDAAAHILSQLITPPL